MSLANEMWSLVGMPVPPYRQRAGTDISPHGHTVKPTVLPLNQCSREYLLLFSMTVWAQSLSAELGAENGFCSTNLWNLLLFYSQQRCKCTWERAQHFRHVYLYFDGLKGRRAGEVGLRDTFKSACCTILSVRKVRQAGRLTPSQQAETALLQW